MFGLYDQFFAAWDPADPLDALLISVWCVPAAFAAQVIWLVGWMVWEQRREPMR